MTQFHLGRSFIPFGQTITLYVEGFTKTWACDVLLFSSWEAYYLLSAPLQPPSEKEDLAFGFRWVAKRPA